MSGNHARSLVPGLADGDALVIAGIAAFVIVLVSCTVGWGLWMAYRTTKILSTAAKTHTTRPVSPSRADTFVSEMSTIEMGKSFSNSGPCNDWESTQLYLRSQNPEIPTCMPTVPERAYVSGWAPLPPTLPRCQTLDAVRSPIMVAHSTSDLCGVDVVLGTSNRALDPVKEARTPPSLPLPLQPILINFDEVSNEQPVVPPAPYYAGLGLTLIDVETIPDDFTAQVKTDAAQDMPLQTATSLLDSTSGTKLSHHISIDPMPVPLQLPSPSLTPTLPTLVLTSAPFKRNSDVIPEQSDPTSQLASPPATPTLLLTGPSIHCGLGSSVEGTVGRDVDEDLESWSDVLGFQEYEDDERCLDHASCRLLDDFPSPPKSPPQHSILGVPPFSSTDHDAHPGLSVPDGNITASQTMDVERATSKVEDNIKEVPFDYAAFRERLSTFLKDVNSQKMIPTPAAEETDKTASVRISRISTSLSSPQFDYGRLRARRRSYTLLNNPAPSATFTGVSPRPLPLPVEFPPLLSRTVDRSKRQGPP